MWQSTQQALKRETSSMLIVEKNVKELVGWPENYKYKSCSLKNMINFGTNPQRMIQFFFLECKWEYQIQVTHFIVDETEAQNGKEIFKVTQLVTVRARIGPEDSQSSFQGSSTTGSNDLRKGRILSKNAWDDYSAAVWLSLETLKDFSRNIPGSFASQDELILLLGTPNTDLDIRRFYRRTAEKCLPLLFLFPLPSWGSVGL